MKNPVAGLLAEREIEPVLVDIGAAGRPPEIWREIAAQSIYVGFDPDARDLPEIRDGVFRRCLVVNEAVSPDPAVREMRLFLTRSAHCSSALRPDAGSLGEYLFADYFRVEGEARVPACSLAGVMERFSLPGIDWLKTDSQGMDLRLFLSLPEEIRDRVQAVDLEPGLVDAYEGEDLFVDVHREMLRQGFWVSQMRVLGDVRMRPETLRAAEGLDERAVRAAVRVSPVWCELRYLRRLEPAGDPPERELLLQWAFAMLDGQFGHALEAAREYGRLHGMGGAEGMRSAAVDAIRAGRPPEDGRADSFLRRAVRGIRRRLLREKGSGTFSGRRPQ